MIKKILLCFVMLYFVVSIGFIYELLTDKKTKLYSQEDCSSKITSINPVKEMVLDVVPKKNKLEKPCIYLYTERQFPVKGEVNFTTTYMIWIWNEKECTFREFVKMFLGELAEEPKDN